MLRKKWIFRTLDLDLVRSLEREAEISPVIAQLLAARRIVPASISEFLEAPLTSLRPPDELHDIPRAASLIVDAIKAKSKICIFGDYDADGITGTAILFRCFRLLHADVIYYVPNRISEGYGLSLSAIDQLHHDGVEFLVSVDCGITSIEQVAHAKRLGMSVVITDHHSMAAELPCADAIVHPQHPDRPYPFSGLSGAGVAFKLAWAVCQRYSGSERVSAPQKSFLMSAVGMAAMGTIADVVPLLDENRILVKQGLMHLTQFSVPGIQQLLKVTQNDKKRSLDTDDVGFSLAPRLNATGRLGQARLGVELLTVDHESRAADLAAYIHHLNDSRESLERGILKAARQQIKDENLQHEPAIVLAGRGWHPGVIGIVAGRIADEYNRPSIIISMDSMKTQPAMGSARSALGVNLFDAINRCREHLISFGGHPFAAGLKIADENIPIFRDEFSRVIAEEFAVARSEPELHIDAEIPLCYLTISTLNQLQKLAPYGAGHPHPLLAASEVEFCDMRRMGKGELHFSAKVAQQNTKLRCVAFGQGDWMEELEQATPPFDIVFRPVVNEFNGFRKVEIQLIDWRPSQDNQTIVPKQHTDPEIAQRLN
ncbi:MAG TPA: single-stranded-DNA-specific exonuclease RecJ [Pirellulaceae bacterium]|nr:single-stranded-DNA-specific exonuclease RecJ [Pirellulaceae bacterium]HMO93183.1 single-stranded-DNA-specific exonuclease RecJ [Pirellulaceae bacterium]HMP69988.1 single-stranded-DNA-specific exonuclease RecJ [Pirellulaceae bacterium]